MAISPDKIDRLKAQLLMSGLSQQNNTLYQVINLLIDTIKDVITETNSSSGGGSSSVVNNITNLTQVIDPFTSLFDDQQSLMPFVPGGETSSVTPTTPQDYVVLSDGVTPTPEPIDDGFGNFIYILYTP